jgi:hypothetical protein
MLSSFYGRIFVMYKPADVTVSFDIMFEKSKE